VITVPDEGYIDVDGGKVWYQVINGRSSGTPLICLHGGPGYPHDYLEPLAGLADARPVIFYDQLGCGNSERPSDARLWILDRFVVELRQVVAALHLERVHILGHSWGSMPLMDYALTRAPELAGLILASPCMSVKRWTEDGRALVAQLPSEMRDSIERNEAAGTTATPEYRTAMHEFSIRHICRLDPWPLAAQRSGAKSNDDIYTVMQGVSEFNITGNFRYYERAERLHEIDLPVLWICGRDDEARPETLAYFQSLVPGSGLAVIQDAGHFAHLEQPEAYLAAIRGFLARADARGAPPSS
jgi:proline iminopeptidase